MFKTLTVCLLICLATSATVQNAEAYVYYYSDEQSAFIIERADGAQRQTLAHFSRPTDYWIIGPGWSTDGMWFAWATDAIGGGIMEPDPPFSIWIVDREGTTSTQLHSGGNVMYMEWSPTRSMLMIIYIDTNYQYTPVLEIFDAQTSQLMFRTELNEFYQWARISQSLWLPDGQHFVMYAPSGVENIYTMSVYTVSGEQVGEREIYYPQPRIWEYHALPTWSSDGKVMYVSPDRESLMIDDFSEFTSIELPFEEDSLVFVDWNPMGRFAFVYAGSLLIGETDNIALWLYDHETQDVILISENSQPNFSNLRGAWFTDRPTSTWREDGEIAYFFDVTQNLYTLTPENREITQIIPDEIDDFFVSGFDNGSWGDAGDLFYMANVSSMGASLFRYRPALNENELIYESAGNFALNSRSAAITNCDYGSGLYGCILDLQANEEFSLQFDYSVYTASPTGYLWHPSGEWLIMVGARTNTFGSIGVTDHTAENVRQLDVYCYLSESCYGWLP